jgi:opacity protein-like surface antigen
VACALALACAAPAAVAQESITERLNIDRLQLTAIGVSGGGVWPSRVNPAQAYAVHADYGEIAPRWRIVLTVTYWGSEFRPEVVRELEQAWRNATIDPSGDDSVVVGTVRISDIAFEVDGRWTPLQSSVLRPFVGGGLGVHVLNAENRILAGTFVESALDMIASGITALAGIDTAPVAGFTFGLQGRYTFISNTRFFTLRAGASYVLAPIRAEP